MQGPQRTIHAPRKLSRLRPPSDRVELCETVRSIVKLAFGELPVDPTASKETYDDGAGLREALCEGA
jgi:hypothetical protein